MFSSKSSRSTAIELRAVRREASEDIPSSPEEERLPPLHLTNDNWATFSLYYDMTVGDSPLIKTAQLANATIDEAVVDGAEAKATYLYYKVTARLDLIKDERYFSCDDIDGDIQGKFKNILDDLDRAEECLARIISSPLRRQIPHARGRAYFLAGSYLSERDDDLETIHGSIDYLENAVKMLNKNCEECTETYRILSEKWQRVAEIEAKNPGGLTFNYYLRAYEYLQKFLDHNVSQMDVARKAGLAAELVKGYIATHQYDKAAEMVEEALKCEALRARHQVLYRQKLQILIQQGKRAEQEHLRRTGEKLPLEVIFDPDFYYRKAGRLAQEHRLEKTIEYASLLCKTAICYADAGHEKKRDKFLSGIRERLRDITSLGKADRSKLSAAQRQKAAVRAVAFSCAKDESLAGKRYRNEYQKFYLADIELTALSQSDVYYWRGVHQLYRANQPSSTPAGRRYKDAALAFNRALVVAQIRPNIESEVGGDSFYLKSINKRNMALARYFLSLLEPACLQHAGKGYTGIIITIVTILLRYQQKLGGVLTEAEFKRCITIISNIVKKCNEVWARDKDRSRINEKFQNPEQWIKTEMISYCKCVSNMWLLNDAHIDPLRLRDLSTDSIGQGSFGTICTGKLLVDTEEDSQEKEIVWKVDPQAGVSELLLMQYFDHPNLLSSYGTFIDAPVFCVLECRRVDGDDGLGTTIAKFKAEVERSGRKTMALVYCHETKEWCFVGPQEQGTRVEERILPLRSGDEDDVTWVEEFVTDETVVGRCQITLPDLCKGSVAEFLTGKPPEFVRLHGPMLQKVLAERLGEYRGDLYIVMDKLEGDLKRLITDKTDFIRDEFLSLPMHARMSICAQLCLGLADLHARGFVHCDLKLANALFTTASPNRPAPSSSDSLDDDEEEEGEDHLPLDMEDKTELLRKIAGRLVKVIDFGLMLNIGAEEARRGNPGWQTPEILPRDYTEYNDHYNYDHNVDMYALGLMIVGILDGTVEPIDEFSQAQSARKRGLVSYKTHLDSGMRGWSLNSFLSMARDVIESCFGDQPRIIATQAGRSLFDSAVEMVKLYEEIEKTLEEDESSLPQLFDNKVYLDFTGMSLTAEKLRKIQVALRGNQQVKALNFSGAHINAEGAIIVAKILQEHPELQLCVLDGNHMDDAVQEIMRAIGANKTPNFQLSLRKCGINRDNFGHLLTVLERKTAQENMGSNYFGRVDLSYNPELENEETREELLQFYQESSDRVVRIILPTPRIDSDFVLSKIAAARGRNAKVSFMYSDPRVAIRVRDSGDPDGNAAELKKTGEGVYVHEPDNMHSLQTFKRFLEILFRVDMRRGGTLAGTLGSIGAFNSFRSMRMVSQGSEASSDIGSQITKILAHTLRIIGPEGYFDFYHAWNDIKCFKTG